MDGGQGQGDPTSSQEEVLGFPAAAAGISADLCLMPRARQ